MRNRVNAKEQVDMIATGIQEQDQQYLWGKFRKAREEGGEPLLQAEFCVEKT